MSIGAINVDILPYVVYGMPTFSSSSSVAFFRQKKDKLLRLKLLLREKNQHVSGEIPVRSSVFYVL